MAATTPVPVISETAAPAATDATAVEPVPLPSRWTLYFHVPVFRKDEGSANAWGIESYVPLMTMSTVDEFWTTFHVLKPEHITNGLYFFMREGIEPRYEDPANTSGGEWKKKVSKEQSYDAFIETCVYAVMDQLLEASALGGAGAPANPDGAPTEAAGSAAGDHITGVTIRANEDGSSNVLKLWNRDASKAAGARFNPAMRFFTHEGVLYESFASKHEKDKKFAARQASAASNKWKGPSH